MTDETLPTRDDLPFFSDVPTRWMDNDAYGHVNNVEYYSYMDTAVNHHLVSSGALDIHNSPAFGVVVETRCRYFKEISHPELVQVGLRVTKLGNSSVTYQIGVFKEGDSELAALGHFVHVYIDRESRRPVTIPDAFRAALTALHG